MSNHIETLPPGLELLVSAQNEWYTQPIPCQARGGVDTAISIGETFFLAIGAPQTPDLEAFLGKTPADVQGRIQSFLNGHPEVSSETVGIVIMDIEAPPPRDFHLHPPRMQRRLSDAFAIRAAAARVKFPKARLGFYGTLIPDGQGRAKNKTYQARKRALIRAGKRGMFDQI